MKRTIVNPYTPYSYKQMMREAQRLAVKYEKILRIGNIGTSVENRELLSIELGFGPKRLLLVGAHHAREYISSAYLMCIAENYACLLLR